MELHQLCPAMRRVAYLLARCFDRYADAAPVGRRDPTGRRSLGITLSALLLAATLLTGCDREVKWNEAIVLANGTSMEVRREETIGPNEFMIPGQGGVRETRFVIPTPHGPVRTPPVSPGAGGLNRFGPQIIDRMGDDIVLVYAIDGGYCGLFDNPSEGVVAFRSDGDEWRRIDVTSLPAGLTTNVNVSTRTGAGETSVSPERVALADLIAKRQEEDSCANQAAAARQAKRSAFNPDIFHAATGTLTLPEGEPPASEMVEAGYLDQHLQGERDDAGCGDVQVDDHIIGRIRFRFSKDVDAFVDVPGCRGCTIWNQAFACDANSVGAAMLVYWPEEKRTLLVVQRLARDGRLLRADSIELPGINWMLPPHLRLGERPSVQLWRRVPEAEPSTFDRVFNIGLPAAAGSDQDG